MRARSWQSKREKCVYRRQRDGPWEAAVVGQGFCEIANNRVMLLADTIEKPEEIDRIRAQEALERRAKERLRQKREHFRVLQHPRGDGESAGSSERDGKICGLGALEADLST
ncbi:MAG: FoF1 ATP synthase subunit delta/epsilon [Clostridium fessum]